MGWVIGVTQAYAADEFNFNWLDPEKKIYVLQNRKYLKANRPQLSVMAGPGISNAYRNTYEISGAFSYYLSEMFGVEVFYSTLNNRENNTFEHLKQAAPNTLPVVREIRSQLGLVAHYVPWYAKINVFNKVLYFDWYFSGGMGSINTALDTRTSASSSPSYSKQDFLALFLGTGHQYHLNQNWIVRFDFTGSIYQAPRFGDSGENTWFSNYLFGFGLGYRI